MRCNGTKNNELDVSDECFDGFAYELIAEIANYNRFKFKFVLNPELGKLQSSGKWNGIIGDLQSMVNLMNVKYFIPLFQCGIFNESP